jgi:hypothetical protein
MNSRHDFKVLFAERPPWRAGRTTKTDRRAQALFPIDYRIRQIVWLRFAGSLNRIRIPICGHLRSLRCRQPSGVYHVKILTIRIIANRLRTAVVPNVRLLAHDARSHRARSFRSRSSNIRMQQVRAHFDNFGVVRSCEIRRGKMTGRWT